MSNYIVSARKYRPVTFDSVVGQSALTTTLKNSIASGRLAHAYLFCGPRGVGKTTCARIFAKTINCLNPKPNGDACEECESCRAFNEQRSYNIHELDAASNNGVDDIRQLIEQVNIPPQVGRYKVFIIDEVHMLSTAAFNAFLKTLEEPPAHAIFILATTEKHKLLPTILSRCQIYDFSRMTIQDIVGHLERVAAQENIKYEPAALNVIAQKADGGMRDALSIFDQVASFCQGNITYQQTIADLNVLDYEYYFKLVDYFLGRNIPEIMLTFNDILSKGFEGSHFIGGLNNHLRNLLVSRDAQTVGLIETSDEIRQRYSQQASKCTPRFLYAAIRKCTDCDLNYKMSQNQRLLVELTLIEIAQLSSDDGNPSGLGPTKILKPIFHPAEEVKPTISQPVSKPQEHTPHVPNPAQPKTTQPPLVNLGFSLRGQQQTDKTAQPETLQASSQTEPTEQQPTKGEAPPLTQENLVVTWRKFAEMLPKEEVAMANRMVGNLPVLQPDQTTLEIVADNPEVEKQFQQMSTRITQYIRQTFAIPTLQMHIRLRTEQDRPQLLGKMEQYKLMCKENPALVLLQNEFQLDLN